MMKFDPLWKTFRHPWCTVLHCIIKFQAELAHKFVQRLPRHDLKHNEDFLKRVPKSHFYHLTAVEELMKSRGVLKNRYDYIVGYLQARVVTSGGQWCLAPTLYRCSNLMDSVKLQYWCKFPISRNFLQLLCLNKLSIPTSMRNLVTSKRLITFHERAPFRSLPALTHFYSFAVNFK